MLSSHVKYAQASKGLTDRQRAHRHTPLGGVNKLETLVLTVSVNT